MASVRDAEKNDNKKKQHTRTRARKCSTVASPSSAGDVKKLMAH